MTEQPLMTADEVAREFQITSTQVLTLARRGEIPCVRLGRWVRFSREHLDEVKARRSPASVAKAEKDKADDALGRPTKGRKAS